MKNHLTLPAILSIWDKMFRLHLDNLKIQFNLSKYRDYFHLGIKQMFTFIKNFNCDLYPIIRALPLTVYLAHYKNSNQFVKLFFQTNSRFLYVTIRVINF